MRPLFTASGLDTAKQCAGSLTLPLVYDEPRDDTLSRAGTAEHAEVLTAESLPENLRQWLTETSGVDSATIYEQSFTVDFLTGESSLTSRNYIDTVPLRNRVLSSYTGGTPDVFNAITVEKADGRRLIYLRLGDLKTGAGQAAGRLPRPSESWQLRYYALAVLLWLSWPTNVELGSCEVAFFTRDFDAEALAQPDVAPTDRAHLWRIESESLSDELLRDSIDELRELTRRLLAGRADFTIGSHCATCRGFRACQAHQSPLRRLGALLEGEITDATAIEAHALIVSARRLIEQADRALNLYMERRGALQTRPGYVLSRERKTTRTITAKALPVLKEAYPTEYPKMVREEASMGRIASALGEAKAGPRTETALERLRAVPGAMSESVSFELRERRDRSE